MASEEFSVLRLDLADETATKRLGADLAMVLRTGDLVALEGDLGAGKSTLARALIRSLAGDPELDVPSPTFTLVQDYALRVPVLHVDLYRIGSPSEADELGLEEGLSRGAVLVEWPQKAGDRLPGQPVTIALSEDGDGRTVEIRGPRSAIARLQRSLAIRAFLDANASPDAQRIFLLGDASTRAYEIVREPGRADRILMDAPRRPDGPPIRDGKPYSQIAHLAESVLPFVAIDELLRARGLAAPEIFAADIDDGILLIEHLGSDGVVEEGRAVPERYLVAAELLAHFHAQPIERAVQVGAHRHTIPPYDRGALNIEVELLVDWFLPATTGKPVEAEMRHAYLAAWEQLFAHLDSAERHLVIRDYHSPNLIWRPEAQGLHRIGVIDFQDAMIGPSAYDVASLAMDARVDIDPDLERRIVGRYCETREKLGSFDRSTFEEAYAIMAAQRNAKILGIFVRLDRRDGKPHYLKHLPRIRSYFERSLAHPVMAPMREFVAASGLLASTDAL